MVKVAVVNRDSYEYGDMALTGVPEQPWSISVFIKDTDNVIQTTLTPAVFAKQGVPIFSVINQGHQSASEMIDRVGQLDSKVVCYNVSRIIWGLTLAPVVPLLNWAFDNYDYIDAISINKRVKEEKNIAGYAIDGKVINVFSKFKLDALIDKTNVKDVNRLSYLTNFIKYSLKEIGDEFSERKEKLPPVKEVLEVCLKKMSANTLLEEVIDKMKINADMIDCNKKHLSPEQCIRINEIADLLFTVLDAKVEEAERQFANPS